MALASWRVRSIGRIDTRSLLITHDSTLPPLTPCHVASFLYLLHESLQRTIASKSPFSHTTEQKRHGAARRLHTFAGVLFIAIHGKSIPDHVHCATTASRREVHPKHSTKPASERIDQFKRCISGAAKSGSSLVCPISPSQSLLSPSTRIPPSAEVPRFQEVRWCRASPDLGFPLPFSPRLSPRFPLRRLYARLCTPSCVAALPRHSPAPRLNRATGPDSG